jgi:hypothetical protein
MKYPGGGGGGIQNYVCTNWIYEHGIEFIVFEERFVIYSGHLIYVDSAMKEVAMGWT